MTHWNVRSHCIPHTRPFTASTMAVLQFFLLTLFVVSTRSSDMFSNMLTLEGGNYNVSWNFNATSDTLEFLVEVRTVGWVGFGVAEAPARNMVDYDVAIGGVMNDGTSYFQVSWSQNVTERFFNRSFNSVLGESITVWLFLPSWFIFDDFYQLKRKWKSLQINFMNCI